MENIDAIGKQLGQAVGQLLDSAGDEMSACNTVVLNDVSDDGYEVASVAVFVSDGRSAPFWTGDSIHPARGRND